MTHARPTRNSPRFDGPGNGVRAGRASALALLFALLTACLGRTDDAGATGVLSLDAGPNIPSDTAPPLPADFEAFTLTLLPGYVPSLGGGCDAQQHRNTLTIDRDHGLAWDFCVYGGLTRPGTLRSASRTLDDEEFDGVISDYSRIHPVPRPSLNVIYDAPQRLLDVQTSSGVSGYVAFDTSHRQPDRTPIDGDAYHALYERLYALSGIAADGLDQTSAPSPNDP